MDQPDQAVMLSFQEEAFFSMHDVSPA